MVLNSRWSTCPLTIFISNWNISNKELGFFCLSLNQDLAYNHKVKSFQFFLFDCSVFWDLYHKNVLLSKDCTHFQLFYLFNISLPWFAFLNCSMPIMATGDCCNSLAIFCSTKKNMYSSKSSLIKWKDPNEAADLNVRSRIIIELKRNKNRISNEKGV